MDIQTLSKHRELWEMEFLLLLFVLSVGDDVAEVLIVQITGHVQREVRKHLIHLVRWLEKNGGYYL